MQLFLCPLDGKCQSIPLLLWAPQIQEEAMLGHVVNVGLLEEIH